VRFGGHDVLEEPLPKIVKMHLENVNAMQTKHQDEKLRILAISTSIKFTKIWKKGRG